MTDADLYQHLWWSDFDLFLLDFHLLQENIFLNNIQWLLLKRKNDIFNNYQDGSVIYSLKQHSVIDWTPKVCYIQGIVPNIFDPISLTTKKKSWKFRIIFEPKQRML